MKKLLALLLVMIMIFPLCISANAEGEVGIKPFYCILFQEPVNEYGQLSDLSIYGPYFYTGQHTLLKDDIVEYEDQSTIPGIAEKLKNTFDEQPEDTYYVHFQLPFAVIHYLNEDIVYLDHAMEVLNDWVEAFLEEYHSIGGKLDGFIIDLEYQAAEAYDLYYRIYPTDKTVFQRIVNHPQYQTKIRPVLEERGFKFYEAATDVTTELWGLTMETGEYKDCAEIWDVAIRNMINAEVSKALYEPVARYYPDAIVTDYQSKNTYNWLKTPSDYGGTGINAGGNAEALGNCSNYNTYFVRPPLHYYVDPNTNVPTYNFPHSYYKAVYENTPFHMFLWDSNIFKDLYAAKGDDEISLWFNGYDYNKENPNSASNTPYYAETVLHISMLNPKPLLSWITIDEHDNDEEYYQYALLVADSILAELTRVLGAADRQTIPMPSTWNDSFVISGMYAGGKNVWRITPDTTKVSKKDFLVQNGNDVVFSVNGKTITFPGGKIIEDGDILEVGTCGYWVETAKDVTPIITNSSNYYEEYPSFMETYENYAPNTEYNYNNALPFAAWEIKKSKDSSAVVVTDPSNPSNQVLALSGNYTVKNVKLPQNITAGDNYADKQTWEITVTLPANMGADEEVILFNCIGQKKKSDDLGIKIAGGKMYFDQAGEYQELAGVDLSAGGTYTIRREMNFKNKEALKSSYYILDASGNVLGYAKNVPMVALEVPMTTIQFGVTNVTGDPVYVDNYKLYVSGVGASFELFDANKGQYLEDATQARAEDTAYRLSWLNASDVEKTYSVVAAYYEGDKLVSEKVVQEVKMAPGTDGIETAIVECEEGKSLLVYLRNDSPDEDDDDIGVSGKPGNKPGNKPSTGADNDGLGLTAIIVLVLAVLSVVGLLVLIFVPGKPKKVVETEEPKEDSVEEQKEEPAEE